MSCDQFEPTLEHREVSVSLASLVWGDEEGIVRREPARCLPHAFHRHEARGVGRQATEFDVMAILAPPTLALAGEPVTGALSMIRK